MKSGFAFRRFLSPAFVREARRIVTLMPLAVAVVVVGIALLTTLFVYQKVLQDSAGVELSAQTARELGAPLTAAQALDEFARPPDQRTELRTGRLNMGPHWVELLLPQPSTVEQQYIKFKSLRLKAGKFWAYERTSEAAPWTYVTSVPWFAIHGGIALAVPERSAAQLMLIGRITPDSFNRALAMEVERSALDRSQFRFERAGGLLFGALLMLGAFIVLISVINRDRVFFLFGAWLLTSLRVAAQNGGWDAAWLGLTLDLPAQRTVLGLSLIAHFILSIGLFEAIFRHELHRLGLRKPLWWLLWAVVLSTSLAWWLIPLRSMPVVWGWGCVSIVFISVSVLAILRKHPTNIAWWYTGAWGIAAAGLVGEMAYASGISKAWPSFFNSQVSALASALVMAIALAARMREERMARIAAQNSALNTLQRFRETYNAMPVGMFSMRLDGTIVEYNPAFGAMFNLEAPSQYRKRITWAEVSNERAFESLVDQSEGGRITDTEIAIPSRGGRRWLHMRAMRKSNQIETWIEDITARKEAEGRLQFLADHDSLTGLLNRRGFNAHLERAITASSTRVVCFAYIDLDRFKLVNDLFGHVAGDQILRQLATRTRELIRPPHLAARVGGDEFILIIFDLEPPAARELCEDLRRALSDRPYQHQDKAFSVAASIGLIRLDPGMSPRDALTAADRSCSEAKRSGGATVIALDSSSSELTSYLDEIRLVANMRERAPVENFFTQLQPIVSLRNPYSSLCYEVLVRMRGGASEAAIPPARFIAAAERNGLMGQIDRWVLRSTLEWLDENPEHRDSLGFCTVNLSGASLNDEKFLQDTIALIRNHADATKKICFEITESVALYDLNTTRRFVDKVKTFGARVALDDFGAGYTSFNYLKELPGDLVKIDGSFIRDVNLNPANYAITRALVELTHEIGMACVAEWAENAEIVHSLLDLGVDYAQGFGLCRPVDRERMLHVNHGLALVQDEKVIDLLREQRSPMPPLRTGPGGRRRTVSG